MSAQSVYGKQAVLPAKAKLEYAIEEKKNIKLLDKADELLDKETLKDEKLAEEATQCLMRYKAILDKITHGGCFVMNLTFLQPCDVDDFYHDHFRVGPGSLSTALSDLLITDEMRAVVGGEELMVRVEVRYDDYIRVRRRLCTTELQRSTSVDSLSATPLPPKETRSRPLLNSLNLATTSTHDSSFADWATDTNTKQLVLKMKQKSQAMTGLEDKHEIAKHQIELQEGMVRSLHREVTRLTQELETAKKVLTDKGKEIDDLTDVMGETIEELLSEKTKLTNKLAMMEQEEKLKNDKVESLEKEVTRVTQEQETAQKVLTDKGKEIEDLTGANKVMKYTIEELLAENTKLTNKLAMLEREQLPLTRATGAAKSASESTEPIPAGQEITSVFLVNDVYGALFGGTSTVNRQVAQFLLRHGATVHCTALQASEEDKRCAVEDGVHLHLPFRIPGDNSTPSLEWLTFDHITRYPDIPQDMKCIVGHAGVTSKAAKNMKQDRCPQAKLVLFNHDMPEDTDYYKGASAQKAMAARKTKQDILEDAKNANAVFSLGSRIYVHFERTYRSLGDSKPREHLMFLPRPSPLFEAISVRPGGGENVVLTVGRVTEVDLAARMMGEVAEKIPNVKLRARGIDEDDWETSKKILEENLHSGRIRPTLLPCGTLEDIAQDMQQAHLVLMPSRAEPFGMIGLEAIAAGVPVLISDQSGLADMIINLIKDGKCPHDMRHRIVKTSVRESDLDEDAKRWAERIVDTLKYSKSEFERAAEYKKQLLESKYWEESHQNLLRVCELIE